MQAGYETAIQLGKKKLAALDPDEVAKRCHVRWDGTAFYLPCFHKEMNLSEVKPPYLILWLHYLTSEGTKRPEGHLISYRDVPGAQFYEAKFMQRAVQPMIKSFGNEPQALIETGVSMGGTVLAQGDASITLSLLPYVPVTYILWAGDSEFQPNGSILFDQTAIGWLCAEDLVVLASLGAYELAGHYQKRSV